MENPFVRLSGYISSKTKQLFRYRIIIIGVLIFSGPIWLMDQGQDLLINSNSRTFGVIVFLGVVTMAAFINWYLAKLFFATRYTGPVYPTREPILADPLQQASEKKVSRFLGVATILIPSVAILNAMKVIKVPYPLDFISPTVWLIGLLAIFFWLIKADPAGSLYIRYSAVWGRQKSVAIAFLIILSLALILPLLLRAFVLNGRENTPTSLFFLFLHLLFLAFSFYIFVSIRTYVFAQSGWWGSRVGIPALLAALLLSFSFLLINCFPLSVLKIDQPWLSLPILLSGVVFYTLIFTLLIRIGLWIRINIILYSFLIGLIISITAVNDFHSVRLRPVASPPSSVPLTEYYRQWILHRSQEIDANPGYPVFIVNSYGGGIRAAAFTNMVMTWLDSVLLTRGHRGFEHYVFSVSGASGGTIGAAVQCAFRSGIPDHGPDGKSNSPLYTLNTFDQLYSHDYLTPVLSNMLGRDIWASASSFHLFSDRSEIQEKLWEGFAKDAVGVNLTREFNAIWDTGAANPARYEVPLLFSNTLNVDDGLKGIMAPVRLEHRDFPATVFIRERVDALNAAAAAKGKASSQSIYLMTGAFLSARFPFISPSGRMGPGYHFMDGGAKDNSGASTSEAIFLTLARYRSQLSAHGEDSVLAHLLGNIHFYFVSISNSAYYDPNDTSRRLVTNRFELTSPLIGIINSGISGNATLADSILRIRYAPDSGKYLGNSADYCKIYPTATAIRDKNGELYTPILPLGWQISESSLQRLRASFTDSLLRYYDGDGIPKVLRAFNNLH